MSINKYHAEKDWRNINGHTVQFDSRKEARRYDTLRLMQLAGAISGLQRQVRFELIPAQRDPETGKVIERKCEYVADFVYFDADGRRVVEDTKAVRTKDYIIKRKLMLYRHGIRIQEI